MKNKMINKIKNFNLKQFCIDNYLIIVLFITVQFNDFLLRMMISEADVSIRPILSNIVFIIILLSTLIFVPKKYQSHLIIFYIYFTSTIAMMNYIYFSYFGNFLSLGQSGQTQQLDDVKESIAQLVTWKMLLFYILPIIFSVGYLKLRKKIDLAPIHKKRWGVLYLSIFLVVSILINVSTMTSSDASRIFKLWNRQSVVDRFGIYTYQISDAYKILSTKYFANVSSEKEAQQLFDEFYTPEQTKQNVNDYTGLMDGRDVYYIHYESAENFPIGLTIDGQEITPTLNKLGETGVYFSNFNSEESYGTSSDTEFTISTSLLPLSDGTVFITNADNSFVTTEKLLRDKNYGVYAFHGNEMSMWNRNNMLPSLGYTELYGQEEIEHTEEDILGPFGLDDGYFYEQTVDIIAEKKAENPDQPIYAQLITLTNHHPFQAGSSQSNLDLGEFESLCPRLSTYMESYNYSDIQLQKFFDSMDERGLLDNAVVVLYGDHNASIPSEEYEMFINYDFAENRLTPAESEHYIEFDGETLRDFKEVPFIIWTKDQIIPPQVNSNVSGMVDVSATMNNLLGVHNPYQMGFDLFEGRDMPVVFPNGSWRTNTTYYSSSNDRYYGVTPTPEEAKEYQKYAETLIELSRDIIYYDLQDGLIDFEYDNEDD